MQASVRCAKSKVLLGILQPLTIIPLLLAILFTKSLPSNVDAQYHIYRNLEDAKARIMLPAKQGGFDALLEDESFLSSSSSTANIPQCGFTLDQDAAIDGQTTLQQPLWQLPDDNSGLDRLVQTYRSVGLVATMQRAYIVCSCIIIPLLLTNWSAHAARTHAFEFMMRPLSKAAVPLAELAFLLGVVGVLLGLLTMVQVGDRLEEWSSFGNMAEYVAVQTFVGAHETTLVPVSCDVPR